MIDVPVIILQWRLKMTLTGCILMMCVLGPLHISPVSGTDFVMCSYGKFHPGYQDEKTSRGPQKCPQEARAA